MNIVISILTDWSCLDRDLNIATVCNPKKLDSSLTHSKTVRNWLLRKISFRCFFLPQKLELVTWTSRSGPKTVYISDTSFLCLKTSRKRSGERTKIWCFFDFGSRGQAHDPFERIQKWMDLRFVFLMLVNLMKSFHSKSQLRIFFWTLRIYK